MGVLGVQRAMLARSSPPSATAAASARNVRILAVDNPQARKSSSVASASPSGLKRGDERLQPAENGARAGNRQLLRDDDRGETRETRVSAPKRGPSADRSQALDEFRVFGSQALGGLV